MDKKYIHYTIISIIITILLIIRWNWILGTIYQNIGISIFIKQCLPNSITYEAIVNNPTGHYSRSSLLLEKALLYKKNAVSVTRLYAYLLLADQHLQESIKLYNQLILVEPNNKIYYLSLGYLYKLIGLNDTAFYFWNNGETAPYFLVIVKDHRNKGSLGEVLDTFELISLLDSSIISSQYHIEAGWAYYRRGDSKSAENEMNNAVKKSQNETTLDQHYAYGEAGIFYAREKDCNPTAIQYLKKSVALNPKHSIYSIWLSGCLLKQGDVISAKQELIRATLSTDKEIKGYAYLRLGQLYENQGDWSNAIYSLEIACNLRQDSVECLNHLGNVYYQDSKFTDALLIFQRLITLSPENPTYRYKIDEIHQLIQEQE